MNSYDRMKALCQHHNIFRFEKISNSPSLFRPGEMSILGYYPTHHLLDVLDAKIGVDTRGGLSHDAWCRGYAMNRNQVGTRIRLHEEYIRKDTPPSYDEWCSKHVSCSHWGLHRAEG